MSDEKRPTLAEYLAAHPRDPNFVFEPFADYSRDGDFMEVYITDKLCYHRQLNRRLAVAYDFETNEVVGFQVYGVGKLVDEERARGPDEYVFVGYGKAPPQGGPT